MEFIDGKRNLTQTKIKNLLKNITDSDVVIILYNDVELPCSKETLFSTLFNEGLINNIVNKDDTITIASENVVLEVLKSDIVSWMKPIKLEKLKLLFNVEKVKENENIERYIAIGRYDEGTNSIYDIRSRLMTQKERKDITQWVNQSIEEYYIKRKYESLRVCMNYDIKTSSKNIDEWFTIDELLEQGIATR